jgi:hypothetical protein
MVRNWLDEKQVWKIPLEHLKEKLGNYLDDVRKVAAVDEEMSRDDNLKIVGHLRKMLNLRGRDLMPADMEQEEERTNPTYSVKFFPDAGSRQLSAPLWWNRMREECGKMVRKIFPQIIESANFRSIKTWWKQRRAWMPSGSSSMRHRLKAYKEMDYRIKKSDRPNKKTVVETISFEQFKEVLESDPISIARVSTKPEPGFKRRALYASDDMSVFIASYASADVEKCMNIDGMVAKQTPMDTVEWTVAMQRCNRNAIDPMWVSLDYSDFNKEHSKVALALLNLELCKGWMRYRKQKSRDIILQKAYCSLWTARAHLNAWVAYPGKEIQRDYSGLWSGHRDTARDNTMMHYIYGQMMRRAVLETTGKKVITKYVGICGDDEDMLHESTENAMLYLGAHAVCGYTINPHKQIVDFEVHEFLQRYAAAGRLPMRPLAPMVATFATGSWYKMSYVYYDTLIDSMNDNLTEMRNRGGDLRVLLNIGRKILNSMFTVIDEDGKKINLEWWEFRHGSQGRNNKKHVLWEATENGKALPQFSKTRIKPFKEAPSKAADEWMEMNEKWCKALEDSEKAAYRNVLLEEAYKPFFLV